MARASPLRLQRAKLLKVRKKNPDDYSIDPESNANQSDLRGQELRQELRQQLRRGEVCPNPCVRTAMQGAETRAAGMALSGHLKRGRSSLFCSVYMNPNNIYVGPMWGRDFGLCSLTSEVRATYSKYLLYSLVCSTRDKLPRSTGHISIEHTRTFVKE